MSLIVVLFACLIVVGSLSSAFAQYPSVADTVAGPESPTVYEAHQVGLSEDGLSWLFISVMIPRDGYVEIDFNGDTAFVAGSQISQTMMDDLAEYARGVLSSDCCCSIYVKMRCACNKGCAHNGDFSGVCESAGLNC